VPTYGYRCQLCGHEYDVWQRMSDEPGAVCPSCGGEGRRLFFPAGIVFKGSGFYKTDSRSTSGDASSSSTSTTTPPAKPSKPSVDTASSSTTAAAAAD
jgi:putative FmdB family regulatory protein